ncbi:MAG: hypothetical protein GC168_00925 [Candidatus Hydrogenedens sp.]|nr:hypothetical protein [Candidatus Hydrogenedens sp.]
MDFSVREFAYPVNSVVGHKLARIVIAWIGVGVISAVIQAGIPERPIDWLYGGFLIGSVVAALLYTSSYIGRAGKNQVGVDKSGIWQVGEDGSRPLCWDDIADIRFHPMSDRAEIVSKDGHKAVELDGALENSNELFMFVAERVADRQVPATTPCQLECSWSAYLLSIGKSLGLYLLAICIFFSFVYSETPWSAVLILWLCAVLGLIAYSSARLPRSISLTSEAITLRFPHRVVRIPAEAIQSVSWRSRDARGQQRVRPLPCITTSTGRHPIDLCHLGTSAFRLYCTLYVWWRQHQPAADMPQAR